MEIKNTSIKDLYLIKNDFFFDKRGSFFKAFNFDIFKKYGLNIDIKESFYSKSNKNVIRGMHFQIPPKDCSKLIYVSSGKIIDVVLDLRKNSETYKKFFLQELSDENRISLYVPEGFAHGFMSLEDNTITNYIQSNVYDKNSDCGIKWNSFGYNWNNIELPIISEKDSTLIDLDDFNSPFII